MDLVTSRLPLGLSKRDQNKATFILCDDQKNGVCGGAILTLFEHCLSRADKTRAQQEAGYSKNGRCIEKL